MATHPVSRKGPVDRTPPTGRLTVTHLLPVGTGVEGVRFSSRNRAGNRPDS